MPPDGVNLQAKVVQRFAEWLATDDDGFCSTSKKQFMNLKFWRETRKYSIRPVSGYLLAVDFDWRSNRLLIENLTTGHFSIFRGSHLKEYIDVIAVTTDNSYVATTRAGVTEACLLMLEDASGTARELGRWDFSALVIRNEMFGKGGYFQPSLWCALSARQDQAVFLGPAEGTAPGMQEHGRPDLRQGIKCVQLGQDPPLIQECPSVARAAVNAAFNPRPGRDHLLTLIFSNDPDVYLDYRRPQVSGFLAIYDTYKREYSLVFRDKLVAINVLVHSSDGAFLFVCCHSKIELLNSETLHTLVSVTLHATPLHPFDKSYKHFAPFFPMMAANNSRFAVLDLKQDHHYSRLDFEDDVTVSVYRIPECHLGRSLRDMCRRHIRARVADDSQMDRLPLPKPLQKYLRWENDFATDR